MIVIVRKNMIQYENGNRLIRIYPNGTKKRYKYLYETEDYRPTRPENLDLNLSYKCDIGCKFCYLNATEQGDIFKFDKHYFDLLFKNIDLRGLEVAMNLNNEPITDNHYQLISYLRDKRVIPNITVNFITFKENYEKIKKLNVEWIGISCSNINQIKELNNLINRNDKIVIHIINHIFNPTDLIKLKKLDNIRNILILGYKNLGRGKTFETKYKSITKLDIDKSNKNIGFDNLALKQIDMTSTKNYDLYYLGEDGTASFYIDLVNKTYSLSSTNKEIQFNIENKNINEMFKHILSLNIV